MQTDYYKQMWKNAFSWKKNHSIPGIGKFGIFIYIYIQLLTKVKKPEDYFKKLINEKNIKLNRNWMF